MAFEQSQESFVLSEYESCNMINEVNGEIMGVILRAVPYKSQYDDDASEYRNDCGPACVAMILNGLGLNVTTNAVFRRSGADRDAYVSVTQMIRAAYTYEIDFDYFYPWSLNDLKEAVSNGMSAITLIHYGAWKNLGLTQSSFTGPHFVTVVGYDEGHIYVNDPLWWGTRRWEGEHKRLTYDEFEKAWSTASYDGNRNYSGIFCKHKLPVETFGLEIDPIEPALPVEPPPPPFQVDPLLKRQIYAWAAYYGIPLTDLDSQAVLTAYLDAMGDWGLRIEVHEVDLDDTLPLLALRYYDDPMKWDVILHFNGMSTRDTIHDGDLLLIPEPNLKPVEIPEALQPIGGTVLHEKFGIETLNHPKPG